MHLAWPLGTTMPKIKSVLFSRWSKKWFEIVDLDFGVNDLEHDLELISPHEYVFVPIINLHERYHPEKPFIKEVRLVAGVSP